MPALLGRVPVRVTGRGEHVGVLSAHERPAPDDLLLVTFDFGVATAEAFGWWDGDGGPRATAEAGPWANDLEGPVMARHPRIREARDVLLAGGATVAAMTGSGPTLVGILPTGSDRWPDELEAIAGRRPVVARPWEEPTVPST